VKKVLGEKSVGRIGRWLGGLSDLGGVSLSDLRVISAVSYIGFTNQKFQKPASGDE